MRDIWVIRQKFKKILKKGHWSNWYQDLDYKLIRECVKLKINISYILVEAKRLWDHSKSIFT